MKYITRTIWILSFISLLTDMASEMLYPIMPIYLKSIGFSIIIIGVLEGIAEAIAGLSKGYFGKLSDHTGKRVPFVQLGYALSAISKPLMALFILPLWVLFVRSMDRLGKGIRTGARDAILSDEATPQTKGKVFGFHRSMDTLGAVIGPLLALVYLAYCPEDYKTLFFIAFIPGLLSILASMLLNDKSQPQSQPQSKPNPSYFSFLNYWKSSPLIYRKVVIGLLVFTLLNSSDVFLLLKLKDSGLNDVQVIGTYIFYNLVYAAFAFPIGILADRIGLKKIFIIGLILFACVYFGMALTQSLPVFLVLFFVYGLYAAATEGISKAWISNITDKKDIATAIGTYAGFQSICTMIASSLAGLIWYNFGAGATFMLTAISSVFVIGYFITLSKPSH
ncbi:MAG: MFS transporter [Bacteroidia bacterium]